MPRLNNLPYGLGFAALMLALGGVSQAHACSLSIQPTQDAWIIQYDPFSGDAPQRQFDVAVTNLGETACSGIVRVDLSGEPFGLSQSAAADRIAYALVEERSGTDVTPRSGQNARRVGARPLNLAPSERALLRFTFAPSAEDLVSSGLYSQDARIALEDAQGLTIAERPVTLGVQVLSAALIGLKGEFSRSNGVARIDLGELAAGAKFLDATLYVLSTGGYQISVQSENAGRLRLGATDWYVNYQLVVGRQDINLSSGAGFSVTSRRPRADDYPLGVKIGSVTGKRAGDYSDLLTFTVAPI